MCNRYKKANLSLDTEIVYDYDDKLDDAVEILQKTGFLVAEKLLEQPDGAYAVIHEHAHWVSPSGSKLKLFSTPDIDLDSGKLTYPDKLEVFMLWLVGSLGLDAVNRYDKAMREWLENPVFEFIDQDYLDEAVLEDQDDYRVIKETKVLIQMVKETQILDQQIQDTDATLESIKF